MRKLNKLLENQFAKNILMVTSGTAFAQVFTIAMSPIITRIYTPEEYGILSVYASLLLLLSIGASLDYQKAIPIAKDNSSANNLIVGSFVILLTFFVLFTLVISLWGDQLLYLLKSESLISYKYLISLGILFIGGYNILLHWALRVKDFNVVTKTKVTQSVLSNISKIGLGLLGIGSLGLVLGQIIGQSSGIFKLSAPIIRERRNFIKTIKLNEIKKQLVRYIKFPLYSAPSNYVYTAGDQAPIIFLTFLFGTSTAGLYGLANSIISLPISLLAISVSQVFYSEVASIGNNNFKKIKKLSMELSKKLALIALIPLLIFVTFGPLLFSLVFGSYWYEAGVYAQILAFVAYAHFVILPSGRIFEVIERQNISLVLNIFRLLLIFLVFICSHFLNFSPIETIILYTIVSTLSYLIMFIVVQRVLSQYS
ncbi:lipopolysaccharide biosynthesis protein [Mesobacillus subterraneus]|uniref:Polysaccharide biosynthesis protein n=1 Tax=Mesobacillus subterraneus TaxID=285983 RepID=A0A427TRE8_9BACI|nr:oligosaccharide flippase family protein [Mesobacillus subterraneus]RSD26957.1 polysaccharide biosynthesis protein [Mesobacillus subterraneus]